MDLNLNQLRIFYFCGKHRTFSEAAGALFLTQPTVTIQIKQLEADLGIGLFHRRGRTMELTEPGRNLFEYAQKIFLLAEEAKKTVQKFKDVQTGVLRIGTLKFYARNMMSALVSAYQGQYPGIQVVLDEGNSQEITNSLVDHQNELGLIAVAAPAPPQLKVIPYFQEELVLVLPSNHPLCEKKLIHLDDLAQESLIVRERGALSREFILDKYREARIVPRILTEASNLVFIVEQVRAGKGISFMAKSVLEGQLKRGSLKIRSLAGGPLMIDVDIAYLKNRTLSPAAHAFVEMMIAGRNGGKLPPEISPFQLKTVFPKQS